MLQEHRNKDGTVVMICERVTGQVGMWMKRSLKHRMVSGSGNTWPLLQGEDKQKKCNLMAEDQDCEDDVDFGSFGDEEKESVHTEVQIQSEGRTGRIARKRWTTQQCVWMKKRWESKHNELDQRERERMRDAVRSDCTLGLLRKVDMRA